MADYKFINQEKAAVLKYPATSIFEGGNGWREYLDYVAEGGETDPWKTPVELLVDAKAEKKREIKQAYFNEEETGTITLGGRTYDSSSTHLVEIDLEARLAADNGETSVIVFDVDDNPQSVPVGSINPAMQQIRAVTRQRRAKAAGLLRNIKSALTVEEVEAISW